MVKNTTRKKILFFSHAVTMAHFTRPMQWVEALDQSQYDIYLACPNEYKKWITVKNLNWIELQCIAADQFYKSVLRASVIYDLATFEEHIEEDINIINQIQPDLVIGDFRLSLSVSCRRLKKRYVNMTNAYWSPRISTPYPLPEAPIVRKLGETLSRIILSPGASILIKFNFFKMVYTLRRPLRSVGLRFNDYRQVMTDGDEVIFFDTADLVQIKHQLKSEKFLGPLVWSMPVELPTWWSKLNKNKKRIFIALGSSGNHDVLPLLIKALAPLDFEIIVALSAKGIALPHFANVFTTDFLPSDEACKKSSVVICNGGSPMAYAALSHGVPVLGIVGNNDQLLNMAHIEKRGAGLYLRFWNLTAKKIVTSVNRLMQEQSFKENAVEIQNEFLRIPMNAKLNETIAENCAVLLDMNSKLQ